MKYRKNKKIIDLENQIDNLDDIITLDNQIKQALNYVYNIKKEKKNVHELLVDLTDMNNNNISTNIKTKFIRNGKEYIKDLYVIMTNEMIKNIKDDSNIQYFSDTTYYCIPPQCKSLKMWILLAFNKNKNKVIICNITLLKNENYETFVTLINHLKNTYSFNPGIMTLDFCKATYKAFKELFPHIQLVPCFFHLIQRLNLHLPQLKNKNKSIKNNAKNITIYICYY